MDSTLKCVALVTAQVGVPIELEYDQIMEALTPGQGLSEEFIGEQLAQMTEDTPIRFKIGEIQSIITRETYLLQTGLTEEKIEKGKPNPPKDNRVGAPYDASEVDYYTEDKVFHPIEYMPFVRMKRDTHIFALNLGGHRFTYKRNLYPEVIKALETLFGPQK